MTDQTKLHSRAAPSKSVPIRKLPLFTPYVVVWSMFGALAVGLLAVLGLAPEWLADFRGGSSFASLSGNSQSAVTARIAADVEELKTSVGKIQLDLAKIQTDVVAQGEQQKSNTTAIAKMQSPQEPDDVAKSSGMSIKGAPASAANDDADAKPEPETASKMSDTDSKASKTTARKPRVINAKSDEKKEAEQPLETGSLGKTKTETISFGPAVVKREPEILGIRLSSGPSVDSLRLSWALLANRNSNTLGRLTPRYTTTGDPNNPTFELVAGPVRSRLEAVQLCNELAAQGIGCALGNYSGNTL